jgi:predicted phosphodiesterase
LTINGSTAVILGDLHAPHYDWAAFSVALQITAAIGPDSVVLNGDIIDNYQVSSYDRDPRRMTEFEADGHRTPPSILLRATTRSG